MFRSSCTWTKKCYTYVDIGINLYNITLNNIQQLAFTNHIKNVNYLCGINIIFSERLSISDVLHSTRELIHALYIRSIAHLVIVSDHHKFYFSCNTWNIQLLYNPCITNKLQYKTLTFVVKLWGMSLWTSARPIQGLYSKHRRFLQMPTYHMIHFYKQYELLVSITMQV